MLVLLMLGLLLMLPELRGGECSLDVVRSSAAAPLADASGTAQAKEGSELLLLRDDRLLALELT